MVLTSLHDKTTGTGRTFWNFLHFNILIAAESEIVLAFSQGSRRSVVWVPWGLRSDIRIALDGPLIPAVPGIPAHLNYRDVLSSVVSIACCFLLYLTQSSKSTRHKKVFTCFIGLEVFVFIWLQTSEGLEVHNPGPTDIPEGTMIP